MSSSGIGAYGTKSIGTSAAVIVDGTSLRRGVVIQNVHATQDLYIGSDSSVATTTGLKIIAGASRELLDYSGPVYGIASGASTDVRYFEVGG
jgi:hypothetical protein